MIDAGLIISYVLIGLCAAAAIVLPLIQAAGNPKSLKKIGISVGALVIAFFVCYALAGDSTMGNTKVTPGAAKMVGAGILLFYVLLIGAIVSIVYTEISKMSK
jgi:hypothetical protein